jgi:hypothetical protein
LIARIVLGRNPASIIAAALFALLIAMWFALPRGRCLQRRIVRR